MSEDLVCWRCGASLSHLSLPLSRMDECRECRSSLHVCRLCIYYDPSVPRSCREDGAEEVKEKERPNFCDWFKPASAAHDTSLSAGDAMARSELDALFGEGEAPPAADDTSTAEALFRKKD